MRHKTINPRKLRERGYAAHLIDIDEYLAALPIAKTGDMIDETELN